MEAGVDRGEGAGSGWGVLGGLDPPGVDLKLARDFAGRFEAGHLGLDTGDGGADSVEESESEGRGDPITDPATEAPVLAPDHEIPMAAPGGTRSDL